MKTGILGLIAGVALGASGAYIVGSSPDAPAGSIAPTLVSVRPAWEPLADGGYALHYTVERCGHLIGDGGTVVRGICLGQREVLPEEVGCAEALLNADAGINELREKLGGL